MGFISSLFSNTGPAKMMAAQNALIAKYMYDNTTEEGQATLHHLTKCLLIESGYQSTDIDLSLENIGAPAYFLLIAAAFNRLDVPPALSGICFRNNWNFIERPLVALNGAENEIRMVHMNIYDKHRLQIFL